MTMQISKKSNFEIKKSSSDPNLPIEFIDQIEEEADLESIIFQRIQKKQRSVSFDFKNDNEESIGFENHSLEQEHEDENSSQEGRKVECFNPKFFGGENYKKREGSMKASSNSLTYENSIKYSENIKKIKKNLDEETTQFICNALKNHFIFANMNDLQM